MIPDTYLDQPVPDDIAKQWHRWEGAKWRQNAYDQKHAGHGQPPSEHPNMHPPEGMCVFHETEWRTWQERVYQSPWTGTILAGTLTGDGHEDLERERWDELSQRQMVAIETTCGQRKNCASTANTTVEPRTIPPVWDGAPIRVWMRACGGETCWCGQPAFMLPEARWFEAFSEPSEAELATTTLGLLRTAVPMYVAEIAREHPTPDLLYQRLDHITALVGAYGEGLTGYGADKKSTKKRLNTAVNALAYGLALTAMVEGGVHCYGTHFEATRAAPVGHPDTVVITDPETAERTPVAYPDAVYNDDHRTHPARRRAVFPEAPPDEVYRRLLKEKRKQNAAFYTPESLTKPTVELTIRQLIEEHGGHVEAQAVLGWSLLDPCVGSGSFLVEAIKQMAAKYLELRQTELGERVPPDRYAEEARQVRFYLTQRNTHAVDINATAVDLTALCLWLNTMTWTPREGT